LYTFETKAFNTWWVALSKAEMLREMLRVVGQFALKYLKSFNAGYRNYAQHKTCYREQIEPCRNKDLTLKYK